MFLDTVPGTLVEPISGRRWESSRVMQEVRDRVVYFASQGITSGNRIFILHGNRLEFFADLLAVWCLGACAIPINTRLTPFELQVLAETARPSHALCPEEFDSSLLEFLQKEGISPLCADRVGGNSQSMNLTSQFSLDQAALILFTSGTTGNPKGVVHTHRSLRARWITLRQSLGLKPYQRTLCLLPTHFGHGLICNCLFPWLSGQDLFILPSFSPNIVLQLGSILDKWKITFMSSVPSIWRLALTMVSPPKQGTLERVFCGSAPLSAHMWEGILNWTKAPEVCNAYGITETGSWVAGSTMPDAQPEDGLVGVPWGAVIKVLKEKSTATPPGFIEECAAGESGYIWLNTPALMQGYFEREDLTNEVVSQGWFMTGDIGAMDERGWLYLRGREREEINKGGMKVYPGDIDAVIERFEDTVDVCCFGYEGDPLYGQNVGVAVVLKVGQVERLSDLYLWAETHLAKFQLPVQWFFLKDIPRTSRGKINRAQVAQVCAKLNPLGPADLQKNKGRS